MEFIESIGGSAIIGSFIGRSKEGHQKKKALRGIDKLDPMATNISSDIDAFIRSNKAVEQSITDQLEKIKLDPSTYDRGMKNISYM